MCKLTSLFVIEYCILYSPDLPSMFFLWCTYQRLCLAVPLFSFCGSVCLVIYGQTEVFVQTA